MSAVVGSFRVLGFGLVSLALGWLVPAPVLAGAPGCGAIGDSPMGDPTGGTHASVLVVLSPRMPYALQEWPRMKRAAGAAGFEVRAVRDPRVPTSEWQAAVLTANQPDLSCIAVLDEVRAVEMGVLHHAPSSVVSWCGRFHPWPIQGVMPDTFWVDLLRQRQGQLMEHTRCS